MLYAHLQRRSLVTAFFVSLLCFCSQASEDPAYIVEKTAPHDPEAFTQGLACPDQTLYESTGLYGASTLRTYKIPDFSPLKHLAVPRRFFGEDLTLWQNKIWQLTWREHTLHVYNLETLSPTQRLYYHGEGWGLTHDDNHFIMSDGSHCLQIRDPESFAILDKKCLFHQNQPLGRINAMDYRDGILLANLYPTDNLAVIDFTTTTVLAVIDLSSLRSQLQNHNAEVLNGVCIQPRGKIIITGKRWDKLFILRLPLLASSRRDD